MSFDLKRILFVFGIKFYLGLVSFSQPSTGKTAPIFQLNHVDVCIDSVTFNAVLNNTFLRDSLAYMKVFTDSTGSEILLLGQRNFLHLLPDKGFFVNRLGACLLVHHCFKWTETARITEYLQNISGIPLYNRPYASSTLHIDYINVQEESENNLLKVIAITQNHSKKDYLSWGYTQANLENGITQTKYMKDYVGKETSSKLFLDIKNLTLDANKKEHDYMTRLLKAYGYKKNGSSYRLNGSPIIYLRKLHSKNRKVKITILLNKTIEQKSLSVSNKMSLAIKGKTLTLEYKEINNTGNVATSQDLGRTRQSRGR